MRILEKSAHEPVDLFFEEKIFYDIDIRLDLIDSVGSISVMCGETFIHPDMAEIAKIFSEKKFWFCIFPYQRIITHIAKAVGWH